MLKLAFIALASGLLLASLAHAETEQQNTPAGPCARGASQVKIGGMDLDEMRCEMAIMQIGNAQVAETLVKTQAKLQLSINDASTKDKTIATMGKAIAWWSDCLKTEACVSWARPAPQLSEKKEH